MQTADVVIIGGGIVGASIAWHLTDAGCRNVLIVERESHQGKGSTGKSMGGVRAQFATSPQHPDVAVLHPVLRQLRRAPGPSRGLPRRRATCSVATKQTHLDYLRDEPGAAEVARPEAGAHGLRAMTSSPWFRSFAPTTSSAAASAPTDGFVDPYSVMVGFTTSACEQGATIWRSTEVTAIQHDGIGHHRRGDLARGR